MRRRRVRLPPVRLRTGHGSAATTREIQHQRWDDIGTGDRVLSSRENMKTLKLSVSLLAFVVVVVFAGCSGTSAKSPDVSDGCAFWSRMAGRSSIGKGLSRAGVTFVLEDERLHHRQRERR